MIQSILETVPVSRARQGLVLSAAVMTAVALKLAALEQSQQLVYYSLHPKGHHKLL
jgi:hypothetical protein